MACGLKDRPVADPTAYTRQFSFSGFQNVNPSKPLPADKVDAELSAVATATAQAVDAIKDIRRSDGRLQNGIVDMDALSQVAVDALQDGELALGWANLSRLWAEQDEDVVVDDGGFSAKHWAAKAEAAASSVEDPLPRDGSLPMTGLFEAPEGADVTGPFRVLGEPIENTDWNAITVTGRYTNGSDTSDAGLPAAAQNMVLVHFQGLGDRAAQFCMRVQGAPQQLYYRYRNASAVWGSWLNLTPSEAPAGIPIGGIILWSGSIASIPSGWALCDGSNGTPNLRNRFVVGAGGAYSVDETGGSDTATTSSSGNHNHGGTNGHALTSGQIPSHSHTQRFRNVDGANVGNTNSGLARSGSDAVPGDVDIFNQGTGSLMEMSISTANAGGGNAHSHGIPNSGNHSHTVDTRSRYYALAYIMRVS